MRRFFIPAVAACALAASAGQAPAQGPGGRDRPGGGPPSVGGPGPGSSGPQREMAPPRAAQPDRPRVDRPARGADGPPRAAERSRQAEPQQPRRERQRAVERERDRSARQERVEQRRNAERERSAERDRTKREQAEQRRNAERERNAERARAAERERAGRERKQAEDRQRREAEQSRGRQADRAKGAERVSERREEMRLARERLGRDERQRLRAAFDFRQARVTNARFERRVGHRIPRHVRLFPISAELIAFFPYYRDYRYVVVDEVICIVDPRTYEIVDVIDQDYYRGGGPRLETAGLSLTRDQIELVRDSIPRDFPEADVRLRLALGAEIPGRVELYEFSPIVLDRIAKLRDYRFLVADAQIVIVHPRDRSIALVIDRA